MPTYEYECCHCQQVIEIFHGMLEEPEISCPHCGSLSLQKLIGTGAGIIFKGSGFYKNDSKNTAPTSKDAAPTNQTPKKEASAS